jgi:hypothetical protein
MCSMAKKYWENGGEANAEGEYVAVIDLEDGKSRPSRFVGKDKGDVAEKMMESFLNLMSEDARRKEAAKANRRPDAPPATLPKPEPPRELTPDERFEITNQLRDPETAPDAIVRSVEAVKGKPLTKEDQNKIATYISTEVRAFLDEHPDYYQDDRNKVLLFNYLDAHKLGLTRNNLAIAYDALVDRNLIILKPENEELDAFNEELDEEERIMERTQPVTPAAGAESSRTGAESTPRTRPRLTSVSTGLRSRDASAQRPRPETAPKVNRAQLAAMGQEEYAEKLKDPSFRKAVDALG